MPKTKTVDTAAPVVAKTEKPPKAEKTPKEAKTPKASKKAAPKAAETIDAAPVDASVAVDASAEGAVVAPSEVPATSAKLVEFGAKLQQISALISSLRAEHKALEKSINRDLKAAQKGSFRRKRSAGNRQPSGFVKPSLISD